MPRDGHDSPAESASQLADRGPRHSSICAVTTKRSARAARGLASAPSDARLHCLSAAALFNLDRYTEAVSATQRALAADPTNEWAHRLHAVALRGIARRNRGRRARRRPAELSVAAAAEAVRCAPANYRAYIVLAESQAFVRDFAAADAAARTAIELAPHQPDPWVCRSLVALAARQFDAARDAAITALRLDPENAAAHNNLGAALARLGKRGAAASAFTEAARLQPTNRTVQRNLWTTGTLLPRFVMAAVLLPLLLVPGVGTALFLVAFVVGNVVLQRSQRLRSWAMRHGARIGATRARRRAGRHEPTWEPSSEVRAADIAPLEPYSPFAVRTSIVLALDALLAFVTLLVLLAIVSPDNAAERVAIAVVAVVLIAIDALLAHVTIKRIRSRRQPETP